MDFDIAKLPNEIIRNIVETVHDQHRRHRTRDEYRDFLIKVEKDIGRNRLYDLLDGRTCVRLDTILTLENTITEAYTALRLRNTKRIIDYYLDSLIIDNKLKELVTYYREKDGNSVHALGPLARLSSSDKLKKGHQGTGVINQYFFHGIKPEKVYQYAISDIVRYTNEDIHLFFKDNPVFCAGIKQLLAQDLLNISVEFAEYISDDILVKLDWSKVKTENLTVDPRITYAMMASQRSYK